MKPARIAGLLLVAVLLTGGAAWLRFESWLSTPLRIDPPGYTLQIPRGEALAVTAGRLAEAGVLEHPRWLVGHARARRIDAKIRAGEYLVTPGTTPLELLRQLEAGQVVQHAVTFVEGWSFREFRRALQRNPVLVQTRRGRNDAEIMSALGAAGLHPEGQFFPDTYLFDRGEDELEVLRRAHERMRSELERTWNSRAADLPLADPQQLLTLASIVEKETALASERPRIAGVFVERLRLGMRLQTDPTVIYGLGAGFDGNLRRRDLERDGPYNTYTRAGLPPTPIAAPGAAALAAAAHPDERDELYFVASGLPDGSHEFSRTLAQHEAAVGRYLQRLRKRRSEHK